MMLSVLKKSFLISLCRNELLQSKFLGLFIVNHSQQSVNVRAASRLIRTEYKRLPNTVRTLEWLDVCTRLRLPLQFALTSHVTLFMNVPFTGQTSTTSATFLETSLFLNCWDNWKKNLRLEMLLPVFVLYMIHAFTPARSRTSKKNRQWPSPAGSLGTYLSAHVIQHVDAAFVAIVIQHCLRPFLPITFSCRPSV